MSQGALIAIGAGGMAYAVIAGLFVYYWTKEARGGLRKAWALWAAVVWPLIIFTALAFKVSFGLDPWE